jgi:hypothetical protein
MSPIRGTLLIAERTYQTNQNVWIIAGVLNQMWVDVVPGQSASVQVQVHVYIRVQVDAPGSFRGCIKLVDRVAAPNEAPVLEIDLNGVVSNPNDVVEMGFALPVFVVECPQQVEVGAPQGQMITAWLRINDQDIASSNLGIIFRHPDDQHGPYRSNPLQQPPGGHHRESDGG